MDEAPSQALRGKRDSSMHVAIGLLRTLYGCYAVTAFRNRAQRIGGTGVGGARYGFYLRGGISEQSCTVDTFVKPKAMPRTVHSVGQALPMIGGFPGNGCQCPVLLAKALVRR